MPKVNDFSNIPGPAFYIIYVISILRKKGKMNNEKKNHNVNVNVNVKNVK